MPLAFIQIADVAGFQIKLELDEAYVADTPPAAPQQNAVNPARALVLDGPGAKAVLAFDHWDGFYVPRKFLKPEGDAFRFRDRSELGELTSEEWLALRQRLRDILARPLTIENQVAHTLFGAQSICAAKLLGTLKLNPIIADGFASLPADAEVARITASAALKLRLNTAVGTQSGSGDLSGHWRFDASISKKALADAVEAAFDIDLPELPAFKLDMKKLRLPALALPGQGWRLGDLPGFFCMGLPSVAGVSFAPGPNAATVNVALTGKNLDVSIVGAGAIGTFKHAAAGDICTISDFSLSHNSGAGRTDAAFTVAIGNGVTVTTALPSPAQLPFEIKGQLETNFALSPLTFGNGVVAANLKITNKIAPLAIVSRGDPSLFLNINVAFEATLDTEGKVSTRPLDLQIIEPYSLNLLLLTGHGAITVADRLIRLIAAIPLPNAPTAGLPTLPIDTLRRLLAHLGRMAAAAVEWMADKAGGALSTAAGVAEAVGRLLGQLLDWIANTADDVFKAVAIEVRLDPSNYALRQIVVSPIKGSDDFDVEGSALGFDLKVAANLKPSLIFDFGSDSWVGLVLQPAADSYATLSTDLWLERETGPQEPMGTLSPTTGESSEKTSRLISLKARPGGTSTTQGPDIVVAALQGGRLKVFQAFASDRPDAAREKDQEIKYGNGNILIRSFHGRGSLRPATLSVEGSDEKEIVLAAKTDFAALKDRLLGLLPKSEEPSGQSGFGDLLTQKFEIQTGNLEVKEVSRTAELGLTLIVHITENLAPQVSLKASVDLTDFSMKLSGGDRISIKADGEKTYEPLGFALTIARKNEKTTGEYEQFYIDLAHGAERMALGSEAKATLAYNRVSTSGGGLQFDISEFGISRSGIDLGARIKPDPVRLGGVDMPFRFQSGDISIKGSRFTGGSLMGAGQLPDTLIGEANASIALTLGRSGNGDVAVQAAHAVIDKSGDPIRCNATRFDITITELGMGFVLEDSYHFYFTITGSARFNPGGGEFATGLLKNFGGLDIQFEKAPLAKDARVLMRSISFLIKLKPPKRMTLFNIFRFELRSIAFYPAHPKFDGDAALGFGGQVEFGQRGDRVSVNINFHEMVVSTPPPGGFLPRIRFDGLTVAIALSGVKVSGTAITVDGEIPSLFRPATLPKNISAKGFLASGTLEIDGWAPLSATMGFLELTRKDSAEKPRHAFFFYGQAYKMSVPIDTPVGTIYLREAGFGFGYRYTIAGIAEAEKAKSPKELVKILDEVSKYQGSLHLHEAWQPTYDNSALTLALRGMLALSGDRRDPYKYDPKFEEKLPNPLLLDIVAALRTDLTVMINLRAWLCVNYNDWVTAESGAEWTRNPTFRGYLYFSAPRREFLGRFISNRKGHIGNRPELPEPLVRAIQGMDYSATLYIRPGLFHFELGWPYELGFDLGKPGDVFHLSLRGGLIQRIEDASVLYGIAFKGKGAVHLEARVGSSSFGASAVADARFDIEARLLGYLSLDRFSDSMYYGYLRIDIMVGVSVEVWLSFKVFGKRISLSVGFSMHLAVSLAIEGVISPSGLGGRAHASISVRAFGRTATLGLGFSFNNGLLEQARTRVARFMELGLSTELPDKSQDGKRVELNPPPEPPGAEAAKTGDAFIDTQLAAPPPLPEPAEPPQFEGRTIGATDFWAVLFPTQRDNGEWFVMQLVPRDHTPLDGAETFAKNNAPATFYATYLAKPNVGTQQPQTWHKLEKQEGGALPSHRFVGAEAELFDGGPCDIDVSAEVGKGDNRPLLGEVIADLFLSRSEIHGDFGVMYDFLTEPHVRKIDNAQAHLPKDATASAAELAHRGRSRLHLEAQDLREAQIEEGRSSILAAVVDSAGKLAEAGDASGNWPALDPEFDARRIGLTFLVKRDQIEDIFPFIGSDAQPRMATFQITKSDSSEPGKVLLFNHPDRMFRSRQPRFAPVATITDQGVMLDWDLEPAWGQSLGAFHDPEFHLRHYCVTRIIRGLAEKEFRATFTARAGGATKLSKSSDGQMHVSRTRPPYQFIDDLRQIGYSSGGATIPEALRDALLGRWDVKALAAAGYDGLDSLVASGKIDILYEIVPVDVAGTSDLGETWIYKPETKPLEPVLSPSAATVQLAYTAMPNNPFAVPAKPLFLMTPPIVDRKPKIPEDGEQIQLRILAEQITALGGYGTDALEEAGRNFDERSIERLIGKGVVDVIVTLIKLGKDKELPEGEVEFVFQASDEDGKASPADRYRATIKRIDGVTIVKPNELLKLMGAIDDTASRGFRHRFFIRKLRKNPTTGELHGAWRAMPTNLVAATSDNKTAVNVILDTFELPRPLDYKALSIANMDMRGESGRLHILHPEARKTLKDLLETGKNGGVLKALRDPARRTGSRLTWKAAAKSLELRNGAPQGPYAKRWVGGYNLFVTDPDSLPAKAKPEDIRKQLAAYAVHFGKVTLLPQFLDGLEPGGFGDFSRLESAYPSETLRIVNAPKGERAKGVRKAGWYSAAETMPMFPDPSIRRSLMPDPDEALIASLFEKGRPEKIRVTLPDWIEPNVDHLPTWQLAISPVDALDVDQTTKEITLPIPTSSDSPTAQIRRLLQSLQLRPKTDNNENAKTASDEEAALLQQRLKAPAAFSAVAIKIEAIRGNKTSAVAETSFDAAPQQNPILLDAMALLAYAPQNRTGADEDKVDDGKVYRRYSVTADPPPETKAATFTDWMSDAPPERDPLGWGALRTLGLAAGFRLYDKDAGAFVLGEKLLKRVNAAFDKALARYADGGKRFNGQPFVDIMTKPWGNATLAWFDGGSRDPGAADTDKLIATRTLAAVQIALRPAPESHVPVTGDNPRIRYFAIKSKNAPKLASWRISLSDSPPADCRCRFDVLASISGLEANPTVRLEQGSVHEFRTENPVIGVVRVVETETGFFKPAEFEKWLIIERRVTLPNGEKADFNILGKADAELVQCERPVAEKEPDDKVIEHAPDLAFGRFEPLSATDWGDVSFKLKPHEAALPQVPEPYFELVPSAAFRNVSYYGGRRFAEVVVPVGKPVKPVPPSTDWTEAGDARGSRAALMSDIIRFGGRFLEHCAPKLSDQTPGIHFSIGTIADPGEWRLAPDAAGELSVLIPDRERRGAQRKFAIVPFGRYDHWIAAGRSLDTGAEAERPQLHEADLDAVPAKFAKQFIDITLPRTEPLERPVVLSALRRPPNFLADGKDILPDANDIGRLELIVAHGMDMVMAEANRKNEALLAPIDLSVAFTREFAHQGWLEGLPGSAGLDPMAEFGAADRTTAYAFPALSEKEAELRLQTVRRIVPDAWLGSTLISAASPPYFFRVHAYVHVAAGIVVSDRTNVSFPEGFVEMARPNVQNEGYKKRFISKPPAWGVVLQNEPTRRHGARQRRLTLDLPLHRFIDCMRVREAEAWFGPDGGHWGKIKPVAHLPEPGVSYSVATETLDAPGGKDVIARVPEFDILPSIPKSQQPGARSRYLVQNIGQTWRLQGDGPAIEPTANGLDWRIALRAAPGKRIAWFDGETSYFETKIDALPATPGDVTGIDVIEEFDVRTGAGPASVDWAANHAAAMAALTASPEASAALGAWAEFPGSGKTLRLLMGRWSIARDGAIARLQALTGLPPTSSTAPRPCLRWLPSREALAEFRPTGAEPAAQKPAESWNALRNTATELTRGAPGRPISGRDPLSAAESNALHTLVDSLGGGERIVTGLHAHRLTCTQAPAPTPTEWAVLFDAAVAALGASPEAAEALEVWKEFPGADKVLVLPLAYPDFTAGSPAATALQALAGGAPAVAGKEHLLLRQPPTDEEMRAFKAVPGAAAIWQPLLKLAEEQLFGPNRRLTVVAAKSGDPPVRQSIDRGL